MAEIAPQPTGKGCGALAMAEVPPLATSSRNFSVLKRQQLWTSRSFFEKIQRTFHHIFFSPKHFCWFTRRFAKKNPFDLQQNPFFWFKEDFCICLLVDEKKPTAGDLDLDPLSGFPRIRNSEGRCRCSRFFNWCLGGRYVAM